MKLAGVQAEVMDRGHGSGLHRVRRQLVKWFPGLTRRIEALTAEMVGPRASPARRAQGAHLLLVSSERLSAIALHEVVNALLAQGGAVSATTLCADIGERVQLEAQLGRVRRVDKQAWDAAKRRLSGQLSARAVQQVRRALMQSAAADEWPKQLRVQVGAALLQCVMQSCRVGIHRTGVTAAVRSQLLHVSPTVRPWTNEQGAARVRAVLGLLDECAGIGLGVSEGEERAADAAARSLLGQHRSEGLGDDDTGDGRAVAIGHSPSLAVVKALFAEPLCSAEASDG